MSLDASHRSITGTHVSIIIYESLVLKAHTTLTEYAVRGCVWLLPLYRSCCTMENESLATVAVNISND